MQTCANYEGYEARGATKDSIRDSSREAVASQEQKSSLVVGLLRITWLQCLGRWQYRWIVCAHMRLFEGVQSNLPAEYRDTARTLINNY